MKESIKIFIKGFIVGISNIIPGVSGGTLAITLGIYDKIIKIISNMFVNFKENIKFMLPLVLGALFSIIALSKIINICLPDWSAELKKIIWLFWWRSRLVLS